MQMSAHPQINRIQNEVKKLNLDIKPPFFYVLSELLLVPAPEDMGTCKLHVDLDGEKWESFEEFATQEFRSAEDMEYAWMQTRLEDFYELELKKNLFFTKNALEEHVREHHHLYVGKLSWSLVHCLKNPEMEAVFNLMAKVSDKND